MKLNKVSNLTWSNAIARLLYYRGVRYACISPGSRNTTLTAAFNSHLKIKCFSHIDERSSAFFALGIAKTSHDPVVIITTSGTAAANIFPAIIDAKLSRIPLIVLTADRPINVINTGETQTINQKNLFGEYVLSMVDVEHKKGNLEDLLNKINLSINSALGLKNGLRGPIHLNLRFDLPLYESCNNKITIPKNSKEYSFKTKNISLPKFKKPLIIAGPTLNKNSSEYIIKFSKKINAPIFFFFLSQMRHYSPKDNVFSMYEHYLGKTTLKPDIIFRFNDKPTSKKLNDFLNKNNNKIYLIINRKKYNDNAPKIIHINIKDINTKIKLGYDIDKKWYDDVLNHETTIAKTLKKKITPLNFQGKLFNHSVKKFKKGSHIFIGSSTPIRSLDEFSGYFNQKINILGNHITRGIDGLSSTALGMAYVNKKNNFLYIGDIGFFYDINAFHILNNESINLVVIIINNRGGQIFSRLPYSSKKIKNFDDFWITPLNTNIKNVAKLFNLKYFKKTINGYINTIHDISSLKGTKLVEIIIDNKKEIECIKKINKELTF